MASQVRETFNLDSLTNALQLDNLEFIPNQHSAVKFGEDIDTSPCAQLNFPPNGNGSLAKKELQTLWEMFTAWLQPEKQSKEQMISQLVLEQFLITGHCKDKFALKENWESSGRNMGRFMEGLTDECLKPPTMVCVSMQGQTALFSENMPLKEVIKHLKQQQATAMPKQKNLQTHLQKPQDMFMETGNENSGDTCNNPWNASERNSGVNSSGEERSPLLIIQIDQYAEPKAKAVSYAVTQSARKTTEVTSKYPIESLRTCFSQTVPTEVKPGLFSRPHKTKNSDDGCYSSSNAREGNHGVSSPANEQVSFPIQADESKDSSASYGVTECLIRATQGTSRPLEYSLRAPSSEDAPVEVLGFLTRPPLVTSSVTLQLLQSNKVNSTWEVHQERIQKDLNTYTSGECPQTFKYPYNHSARQKKTRKKRSFFCSKCHKGFYNQSDLRVHEIIHKKEKPFKCHTCKRPFSHKTNLKAHERIHTGEKPYTCFLCNKSFCQSSTYHRHMRNCHKFH